MEIVTNGEFVQWKKDNANLIDPVKNTIQKGIKDYDEVYFCWYEGDTPRKCYYMGVDENIEPWGDRVRLFFTKKNGTFYKGEHTLWLQDLGLGKTPKEAKENYLKYKWINRKKTLIPNTIFWAQKRKEIEYAG